MNFFSSCVMFLVSGVGFSSITWWSWWRTLLSVLYGTSTGLLSPLTPLLYQHSASFSAVSSPAWCSCSCTMPFFIPTGRALDAHRAARVSILTPLLSSPHYHLKVPPTRCVPTEVPPQPWSVTWGSILSGMAVCQCFRSDPQCHPPHRLALHA